MEHHFNTKIAEMLGIEEAIIIHHFFFCIAKNAANDKYFHDGLYWTYNSKKAYATFFSYMNETKVARVIKHLETDGIVVKGNYNDDKWDRTNWYAITKKGIEILGKCGYSTEVILPLVQNDSMDSCKMTNGASQNDSMITDNNTNSKEEDTNVSPKKNDYKEIVDCWNEYNGKRLGKVTKLTDKRKKAIKRAMDDNDITQEQLMLLFKILPLADSWLYNPNKQHRNWKPDFDWWMANTNGWLTKALEGKVHVENPQVFNEIMQGGEANIIYAPQGRTIWYEENTKSYWTDDNFYYGVISDGYTDDNRPDGATLTMSNARGTITWNSSTKKWEKQ